MIKNGLLLRDFAHNNDSEVLTDEEIEEFQILEDQLNITPDNQKCIQTDNLKSFCGIGTSCSSQVKLYMSDDSGKLHDNNFQKMYNFSRKDVIIIHGYQSNSQAKATQIMKKSNFF